MTRGVWGGVHPLHLLQALQTLEVLNGLPATEPLQTRYNPLRRVTSKGPQRLRCEQTGWKIRNDRHSDSPGSEIL